jgi:hypothetical protein
MRKPTNKETAMTVNELIEQLGQADGEAEVKIASMAVWPPIFAGVDKTMQMAADGIVRDNTVVYLVQGAADGALDLEAATRAGFRDDCIDDEDYEPEFGIDKER